MHSVAKFEDFWSYYVGLRIWQAKMGKLYVVVFLFTWIFSQQK